MNTTEPKPVAYRVQHRKTNQIGFVEAEFYVEGMYPDHNVMPVFEVVPVSADIDYRELLKKYMSHVGNAEGSVFLPVTLWDSGVEFTGPEIHELNVIATEAQEAR